MAEDFNPRAEAIKIETLARQTMADFTSGHMADAQTHEKALGDELASLWSDKHKIKQVSTQLKELGGNAFSGFPNVGVERDHDLGTVPSISFSQSFWDNRSLWQIRTELLATNNGKSIDLSLGKGQNGGPTPLKYSIPVFEVKKCN